MDEFEFRCPATKSRLFGKMLGEAPSIVPGNLLEVSCRDCTREARKDDPEVVRVLHRFNVVGEHIEDGVQRADT